MPKTPRKMNFSTYAKYVLVSGKIVYLYVPDAFTEEMLKNQSVLDIMSDFYGEKVTYAERKRETLKFYLAKTLDVKVALICALYTLISSLPSRIDTPDSVDQIFMVHFISCFASMLKNGETATFSVNETVAFDFFLRVVTPITSDYVGALTRANTRTGGELDIRVSFALTKLHNDIIQEIDRWMDES
mgnify:CR=1 FL=1